MFKKVLPLLCILLLSGCGSAAGTLAQETVSHTPEAIAEKEENSIDFFSMDTYMTIRAWGADDALLASAKSLVEKLESELSATDESSAVYTLNHTGSAVLPSDAAFLIGRALQLCAETDGALDISIYPVVRAWGFTTTNENYRVPEPEELETLLDAVGFRHISLDEGKATLPDGMEIDLGAVTKGYAGDQIAGLLRESGVENALMDLGGNIQAVGTKPDGTDWRIAVQAPEGDGILGVMSISDKAVITSGGYERYFVDSDGNLWCHIMDPATGYPAQNGLISVTVIGDEGLYCDALSTALFIMGPERAIQFWQEHHDFEMILVTDSGEVCLTPDLIGNFTPADTPLYSFKVIGNV